MGRRRGERARGRPPTLGGGSAPAGYSLITGWGSLNDADSAVDAGSGMSAGTWTMITKAAYILQVDGYQENFAGYDIPLTTLYPDWSDTTDRLDLCLEIAAMPLGTHKWGFAAFVGDNTYANRATMAAKGLHTFGNSGTVVQGGEVGPLGNQTAIANGSNTNVVQQIFGSYTWDGGGLPRVIGRTKRTSDNLEMTIVGSPPAAMGAAANRRIYLAAWHVSIVGIATTISARLYARRIRTTNPFV